METCTMSMAEIGAKLRNIREQQDLSVYDVQVKSQGEFKASAITSYERGDREINMLRLKALADFYNVPVQWILTK